MLLPAQPIQRPTSSRCSKDSWVRPCSKISKSPSKLLNNKLRRNLPPSRTTNSSNKKVSNRTLKRKTRLSRLQLNLLHNTKFRSNNNRRAQLSSKCILSSNSNSGLWHLQCSQWWTLISISTCSSLLPCTTVCHPQWIHIRCLKWCSTLLSSSIHRWWAPCPIALHRLSYNIHQCSSKYRPYRAQQLNNKHPKNKILFRQNRKSTLGFLKIWWTLSCKTKCHLSKEQTVLRTLCKWRRCQRREVSHLGAHNHSLAISSEIVWSFQAYENMGLINI